ncbi:hypothetical protein GV827_17555 [Sulfitobacter sp. JBTF-M27]|uniref:Uncharacterized protein n=2 Tax=Sulfitobacter sediminilitoris TaxID=2698830 RepID=A0A6P0CGK1_9RHOB|nr:hypothetical protein [Sulfitobacter sediminilitoris]NEK24195.1 hypothetical protein [Sulfitobacter sediminilitoris]
MKPLPNPGKTTPLSRLIEGRIIELGLSEKTFLADLGYRNFSKGRERLLQFRKAKGLRGLKHLENQLAEALKVDVSTVQKAISETWVTAQLWEDEKYAASFEPHAVLKTDRTRPSQITMCALTGGPQRWLVVEFERDSAPVTYVSQVLRDLPEIAPFFGKVLGFWINYTPSSCVEFDRSGQAVAEFSRAKRVGVALAGGVEKILSIA